MSFLWLEVFGSRAQLEYARAYERAVKSGSLDSVISWELGGYRAEDGTIVTEVPDSVKEQLKKNLLYADAIIRIDTAVRGLREARFISKLWQGARS